jgi:hypothetical protein
MDRIQNINFKQHFLLLLHRGSLYVVVHLLNMNLYFDMEADIVV